MACYALVEDFQALSDHGINTLLVDLNADGSDWKPIYDAAIKHQMKLIPLIWTASRKDKIAGLAWYCFRNPSTEYVHWLHKDRQDSEGNDRWQVMRRVGEQLIDK